jgi:hypothetical protein
LEPAECHEFLVNIELAELSASGRLHRKRKCEVSETITEPTQLSQSRRKWRVAHGLMVVVVPPVLVKQWVIEVQKLTRGRVVPLLSSSVKMMNR